MARSQPPRVNRCTGRGIQQPSLEVYADGEMRGHHALDDDWASSFRDSGRHWLRWLRTGEGPLLWSGEEAVNVLRFALAAYASNAAGGIGVNGPEVVQPEPRVIVTGIVFNEGQLRPAHRTVIPACVGRSRRGKQRTRGGHLYELTAIHRNYFRSEV